MAFDPRIHHRRSIRRPDYDYSADGGYFVTICAHNRSCLFGAVVNGRVMLSDAGRMIGSVWQDLPNHCPGIELDEFIVMPNHVHGVIHLRDPDGNARVTRSEPTRCGRDASPNGTGDGTLGRIVQRFKSTTTTLYVDGVKRHGWPRFSGHVWQRDYFDHAIRSDPSLDRIRDYIRTNPQRWGDDAENPVGTGGDDVRAWVDATGRGEPCVRPPVRNAAERANTRFAPTETGPPVATTTEPTEPTGPTEGRTQGSPLRERADTLRPAFRIGHGYDLHRLQSGGVLMLAGVAVAHDVSPVAHSDGDVVIHAVVDALLGALGWGDIGEEFPNTDPAWKDAPSRVFLERVYERVTAAGYGVSNLDVTILAERPKLKPFKREMVDRLAEFLKVLPDQINVKAGTNEGCDAIGRGEAIAAHAVVLLARAD